MGVPGEPINLGGTDYVLSALTFRQLGEGRAADIEAVQEALKAGLVFSAEHTEPMARILKASLSRNYPDVTEAECMGLLDLGNFRHVFQAILGLTGLMRETTGKGEMKAAGA